MALINCKECSKQISDTSEQCPHCGFKNSKKTSLVTYLVLGFIVFMVFYGAAQQSPDNKQPANIAETSSLPRPSALAGNTYEQICLDAGWRIRGGGSANSEIEPYMLNAGFIDTEDVKNIKNTTIRVGGSRCMLIASWGNANDINTTTNQYSVSRQHVYGNSYVYTDNDLIRTIQE